MDTRDPSPWAGVRYFVVTVLSFGLLAWVPFVHAAGRPRRRSVVVLAVVYIVGGVQQAWLWRPDLPRQYDDAGPRRRHPAGVLTDRNGLP